MCRQNNKTANAVVFRDDNNIDDDCRPAGVEKQIELERARAATAEAQKEASMARLQEMDRLAQPHQGVGVDTASSISPADLVHLLRPENNAQIEPWFEPYTGSFNKVKSKRDGTFEVESGTQSTIFCPKLHSRTTTAGARTSNGLAETVVQATWAARSHSIHAVAESRGLKWHDTHGTKWLCRNPTSTSSKRAKAPDGVCLHAAATELDAHLAEKIVDNKAYTPNATGHFTAFKEDDIGKVLNYAIIILESYQTRRQEFDCALDNGRFAQVFKLRRAGREARYPFWFQQTRLLNLQHAEDCQLYAGFLSSKSLVPLPPADVKLGKCLGRGATSTVFADPTNPEQVVKLANTEDSDFSWEKTVLEQLAEEVGMLQVVQHTRTCLVLTPRFLPCALDDYHLLTTLIDEQGHLRRLHRRGFAHCDLRPPNIMKMESGDRLALADFGAAKRLDTEGEFNQGTFGFASRRVRQLMAQSRGQVEIRVSFSIADDMESFCLCTLAIVFKLDLAELRLKSRVFDAPGVSEWWANKVGKFKLTASLLTAARGDHPHDDVLNVLREEFQQQAPAL